MAQVVLVTGVSRDLSARFARALAAEGDIDVIGVDVAPPRHELGAVNFVRADIRNPAISKVILGSQVDTVVHMATLATPGSAGGRSTMKEINVVGTMQLLASCQRAESVRKLVLQSSAAVYGASPRDPVKYTEETPPQAPPQTGFGKDSVEIETYLRGLARRRPDVVVTTLRLAHLMGAGVDSEIARYLSLPVVPKVLGFDARLQFLHPVDAVEALLTVTRSDVPGTFNVGADDVVPLSQALRMMGRPPIGVPKRLAPALAGVARHAGLLEFPPDQIDALTYGRGMDCSRIAEVTGFRPRYSSRQALEEFVALAQPGLLAEQRVDRALDSLASLLAPQARR